MLCVWLLLHTLRLHALGAPHEIKSKNLQSEQKPAGKDRTLAVNPTKESWGQTPNLAKEPWGQALNPAKEPWALGPEASQPGVFATTCDFEAYPSDNITVGIRSFNEPLEPLEHLLGLCWLVGFISLLMQTCRKFQGSCKNETLGKLEKKAVQ